MGKPRGLIECPATIPGFKGKGNYDSGNGKGKGNYESGKGKDNYGIGKGKGKGDLHSGKGKDSGKGKGKGTDSKGRSGPPVLDSVRQTIPKGLVYQATSDGRHAQLPPLTEPAQPSLEAIFDSSNPHSIVEYPRYLAEPEFECARGHRILLSRIPWQSGCALCQVLGQA